jgi:hypothetical protein
MLLASVNILSNPFYIFYLDNQHPVLLKKLPVSTELKISSIPLSLNVLVYAHASVGVFTRTPLLPYPTWWSQLFSGWMEHLWMDAWLYFPGFKVGQIYVYSSFLTILDKVALILNRCGVRFLFLGHTVG